VSAHADAVATLTDWRPPTPEQADLASAYIARLAQDPDALLRSSFPRHLTAGALVLSEDRARVLLNLHRKARRWFHFGGHIEGGDASLRAAAEREVLEESGLGSVRLSPEPVQLSAHPVPFCDPRGEVIHLDVRYVAWAPADARPVVSQESVSVAWFDVDDLPTDDPDMLELVALARTV
jgi:8-oxo-dGTP pyrophosphatase MutT (NUDIX family)